MSREEKPSKFERWSGLWQSWHEWLDSNSVQALQACLAFPLSFPEIDNIIVGADSVSQLEQIISAISGPLPESLPNLTYDAEDIINPARWDTL